MSARSTQMQARYSTSSVSTWPERRRLTCDQDIPTARIPLTTTRTRWVTVRRFSAENSCKSIISQMRATQNAMDNKTPTTPSERWVACRKTTHPMTRTIPRRI